MNITLTVMFNKGYIVLHVETIKSRKKKEGANMHGTVTENFMERLWQTITPLEINKDINENKRIS